MQKVRTPERLLRLHHIMPRCIMEKALKAKNNLDDVVRFKLSLSHSENIL